MTKRGASCPASLAGREGCALAQLEALAGWNDRQDPAMRRCEAEGCAAAAADAAAVRAFLLLSGFAQ